MRLRRSILLAFLLGWLISGAALAVVTRVDLNTPAGPPLEGATLRIADSQGKVVKERKSDAEGGVLIDLPDGDYTASTIDGQYSVKLHAGDRVSLTVPTLYGILDDVGALADYFEKFQGTAAEREVAWKLMSEDVARKVRARIERAPSPKTGNEGSEKTIRENNKAEGRSGGEAPAHGPPASSGAVESGSGSESRISRPTTGMTGTEGEGGGVRTIGKPAGSTGSESGSSKGGARSGAGEGNGTSIGFPGQTIPPIFFWFYPRNQKGHGHHGHWTGLREGTAIAIGNPTHLNPPGSDGKADSLIQRMMIELSPSTGSVTVPARSRIRLPLARSEIVTASWERSVDHRERNAILRLRGGATFAVLSRSATSDHPRLAQAGPRYVAEQQSKESASPVGSVKLFLTNNGGSTGKVFQADLVNEGSEPATLPAGSLVVEPLEKKQWKKIRKQLAGLGKNVLSMKVEGYCLELLKIPPVAGQVFRVAAAPLQKKYEPVRRILAASRRLYRSGDLNPDIDAKQYFQSIRQWAIWTEEQHFDRESFLDAFIENTRKNMIAAGRKWNPRFATELRRALSGRWSDIQRILRESGL